MKTFYIVFLTLFFVPSFFLPAEDTKTAKDQKKETKDETKSITEEQRNVLKYGIDSEILPLIKKLTQEKNKDLVDDVYALFTSTENTELRIECLNYFIELKSDIAVKEARNILEQYKEKDSDLVLKTVEYVSVLKDPQSLKMFPGMAGENDKLTIALIKGLGESGDGQYSGFLTDYYNKEDLSENVRAQVILALGKIKAEDSFGLLKKVAENPDETVVIRGYACNALGELGNPDAIDSLEKAYKSKDTILRSYAVYALGLIDDPKTTEILMDALRDSYWKVRVYAAEGLGKKKDQDAVPILTYKAQRDPENNVRNAAIEALGEIGTKDARDVVTELYLSNRTPFTVRSKALDTLVADFLAQSIDTFKKIMNQEWERQNSQLLEITCRRLSTAESPALADLFEKMLSHPSITVKIHGLRGIKNNKFTRFKDKVEKLSEEGNPSAVRQNALATLEVL